MARHISTDGRRGIASWVIVAAVVLVVAVAATVGYVLIVDSADDDAAAGACTGAVVLPVAAAPDLAPVITAAAQAFDATLPIARSACVTTSVTVVPGDRAATQLTSSWPSADGAAPAVWVVDSERDLRALEAADSGLTAGRDADPLAAAPVLLALALANAAPDGGGPGLTWADLPGAAGPDGTAILPSGEHLILATPDPRTSRGTSLALQSVLAAGSAAGQPVDVAAVQAAGPALAAVAAGGPAPQPESTIAALGALAAGQAGSTAVPALSTQLVVHNDTADPGSELLGLSPGGPTVAAPVHVVPLTASWVDPTLKEAAAAFLAYLRSPAGGEPLTKGGLVGTDGTPATGGTPPAASDLRPPGGADVDDALAVALGR